MEHTVETHLEEPVIYVCFGYTKTRSIPLCSFSEPSEAIDFCNSLNRKHNQIKPKNNPTGIEFYDYSIVELY